MNDFRAKLVPFRHIPSAEIRRQLNENFAWTGRTEYLKTQPGLIEQMGLQN
jgi:hypothetical protein